MMGFMYMVHQRRRNQINYLHRRRINQWVCFCLLKERISYWAVTFWLCSILCWVYNTAPVMRCQNHVASYCCCSNSIGGFMVWWTS